LEFILLKKYFKRSSLSTEKDEMNRIEEKCWNDKDRGQEKHWAGFAGQK
jgi:hypothetical protein